MAVYYGVSVAKKELVPRTLKGTYMIPYPSLAPSTLKGPTVIKPKNPYGMICQKLNSDSLIHIDGLVFDQDGGAGSGSDMMVDFSLRYDNHSGGTSLYSMGTVDLRQLPSFQVDDSENPMLCVIVDRTFELPGIPDVNTGFMIMLEQIGGTASGNELNLQFGVY